jgi:LAO/AO transport system kinase
VQVAKAGILEIADVFVVNKADREGAEASARDLRQMIRMGAEQEWTPPVVTTSGVEGEGIAELWEAVDAHRQHQETTGALERGRRGRLLREVQSLTAERLRGAIRELLDADAPLSDDLAERRIDPYRAAAILMERVLERP